MTIIDRFTRDRVSRYIWAVLTLGCLATVLFVGQQQTRTLANEVAAAQAQTRDIANTVLFDNLRYGTTTAPIPAPLYRDIIVSLQSSVFTDANIARVRIWRPDGTLQFSTHERDKVGLLKTEDKTLIDQAMQGDSVSARVLTPFSATSTGNDQVPTDLLEVFVPLHVPDRIAVTGVAEVDYYYDNLVKVSHDQWFKLIVAFFAAAGLCLIMTLLSFRKPVKTLGGGVSSGLGGDPVEPGRSARHASGPSADKAVKAALQEAERAAARATKAEADSADVREKLKQTQADLASASAIAADTIKVTELQASLTRAESQLAAMAIDRPDDTLQPRVNELEQDIALAVERTHTAEQRMREAEDRALAAEDKALEEAERARAAEDAVTAAAEAAAAAAVVVQPPEPTPGPAALDDAVLAQFEERIVAAEERAGSAEARLKGLLEMPTASAQEPTAQEQPTAQEPTAVDAAAAVDDLRTRLARTASRKKLGGDDGSPAPTSRVETAAVQVAPGADLQRSMAGEIHGPLSTLKGLALSLKGAVSTSEGKEMVRQMNATVKKLDRLASDLAEAAEISDGSLQLNRRRTDLAAFVSRVVGEADGISNLDIRMELDPAHASVDPSRLQQIVDGMLNHARERTGASETIHIRLTGDDDGATLAVDDEGDPNAGVGPHLLLASRLAELHGGRLWSEPRTAGDGASVKVFLPAEPSKT